MGIKRNDYRTKGGLRSYGEALSQMWARNASW